MVFGLVLVIYCVLATMLLNCASGIVAQLILAALMAAFENIANVRRQASLTFSYPVLVWLY